MRWPNFTIPAVDPRDMGRAAAAVLGDPRPHRGRCYEISGPRKLTTKEPREGGRGKTAATAKPQAFGGSSRACGSSLLLVFGSALWMSTGGWGAVAETRWCRQLQTST